MRRILFLASMLASGYALAQTGNVGINTANPAATLEITQQPMQLLQQQPMKGF